MVMRQYKFIKTGKEWYVDLPEYLEQGGSMGDLQMVEGADAMLDFIAGVENEVFLYIDREHFQGSDRLELREKCEPYIGGGYYFLKEYNGKAINQTLWLCQVTEFVFGDIPDQLFIKKAEV